MKPPPFDYRDPTTVDDVLSLLAEHTDDATLLAGGQSLMPLLNMRLARPEVLIDLNRVAGLDRITITDDAVTLGATVRLATVEHDTGIAGAMPVLAEAASRVAHPQIRVRSTLGGTLCHADPAAEMPTVAVALGARIHLRSRGAARVVPAADFFETVFTTAKQPDELLVAVEFPRRPGMTVFYDEISRRHGDFPFAGLCLGVRTEAGVVAEVIAAAAGVADRPVRLVGLEAAVLGRPLAEAVEDAAAAASAEIDPPADHHGTVAFRRGLLRTLVRRLAARFEETR
ncbi:xanthine dehydrogenase family protein subunit M [Pseudonocardia petroleophila]|uniref:FAD binding domain-containing protein n=1 Tax=Pseudonocardia petroleophila TaxID=37331 RepID=A0A7G7MKI8_9PSEU|nr:FAD binding domain-containing protein [Pseudonocardia petroleophila]QNG53299.1 FAD binding domain-containing protein [Pseudonocardia petroleophila]